MSNVSRCTYNEIHSIRKVLREQGGDLGPDAGDPELPVLPLWTDDGE